MTTIRVVQLRLPLGYAPPPVPEQIDPIVAQVIPPARDTPHRLPAVVGVVVCDEEIAPQI